MGGDILVPVQCSPFCSVNSHENNAEKLGDHIHLRRFLGESETIYKASHHVIKPILCNQPSTYSILTCTGAVVKSTSPKECAARPAPWPDSCNDDKECPQTVSYGHPLSAVVA